MRRWTARILVAFCGLIGVAAIAGATYQCLATRQELAATPPPGRLVDIGRHRLHLWCTGDGAPAVILDTGLGGSTPGWGLVQPEVARFTRVCSYDRAGMGYSDPGPSPRTARRIASELAELLARSGLGGPVVLVGASIAGFYVRVFASDHPERAAGLVLVDASHEDDAHDVPWMARFVPLLGRREWRRLQEDLASLSARGCLTIAEQSGHVVPIDQPRVVVDAIRAVVDTARGHDVPLCGIPAPNAHRDPRRQ